MYVNKRVCFLAVAAFGTPTYCLSQATDTKLTPEIAKDALLTMMRSKAGQEIDWFKGKIPDEMAKLKIKKDEGGWYAWSAFHFHPAKSIYTLTIVPKEGVRDCIFEYEGTFERKDGIWSASIPKLVRTALLPGG